MNICKWSTSAQWLINNKPLHWRQQWNLSSVLAAIFNEQSKHNDRLNRNCLSVSPEQHLSTSSECKLRWATFEWRPFWNGFCRISSSRFLIGRTDKFASFFSFSLFFIYATVKITAIKCLLRIVLGKLYKMYRANCVRVKLAWSWIYLFKVFSEDSPCSSSLKSES